MKSKKCLKCENELPATKDYFYRHKGRKDGLQAYCKKCMVADAKQKYKDKKKQSGGTKRSCWTKEEDEYLLKYAEFDGLRSVAYGLNRSYIATQNRHSKLRKEKEMQE